MKNDFEKLANSLLGNSFILRAIFGAFNACDTSIIYNQNT